MGYFPLFLENYYQTTRDGFSSLCVYLSIPVCPRFLEYPRILITFYEALQDWDLGGHSSAKPLAKSLQGFQFRGGGAGEDTLLFYGSHSPAREVRPLRPSSPLLGSVPP